MKQKRSTPRHPAPESTARQLESGTSPTSRAGRHQFCGHYRDGNQLVKAIGTHLVANSTDHNANERPRISPNEGPDGKATRVEGSAPGLQLTTLKQVPVDHLEQPVEDHLDMAAVVIEAFDADDELYLPDTAIAPLDDESTDAKEGQR